ncbi:hypothetical protein [Anaerosporobacter sp.]
MRKKIALLLSLALVLSIATACGKKEAKQEETQQVETQQEETQQGTAKTGLAVITSTAKSTDATADAEGLAQVDSTVVAVLVDEDGKILDCAIDAAQTQINFSADGKITTDLATEFQSKQELGTNYGLGDSSSIGKEWNEQVDAFADYVVGKTVDEVKGIALTEGVPSDADLTSSVTIRVGDFISGVEKAVNNAKSLGANADDKLGLGVTTNIAKSTDAGEADGVAQAYSNYSAVTTDKDGKITSCVIDASQSDVNFSATGAITSDLTVAPQTKQEIGTGYGLADKSGIGKEWFEQVDALAQYVAGKTVDEVKGIAITEEGVPTDSDLSSSVTIKIGDYTTVIDKAVANAR